MARGSKSQWEFGELFPEKELRQVLSVGELTTRIKRQLETQFKDVWVSGEISNYRLQSSGHAYFVLKDASAQLSCVLFRGQSGVVREQLRDGVKVRLNGEITVYEPRGQYQLRVSGVEIEGIGALQIAFERLKQKLSAEGLFATERKRLIPLYPRRIGIVTSPTGAALQDIVNVVQRRDPQLEIVLVSSRVQGSEAAAEIAAGISRLNRWSSSGNSPLDLILVTRGGGSLEDLWAFNEEVVARAIAASDLPVISAVGHEIDFTIADFVADLRAATPSAAAEIITQSIMESRTFVGDASSGLSLLARRLFRRVSQTGEELRGRLMRRHPRRRIEEQGQRLDDLVESLRRNLFASGRRSHLEIRHQLQRLRSARPSVRVREIDRRFVERLRQLRNNLGRQLLARQEQIRQRDQALQLLSPQNVLNRGYSMTLDVTTNEVIRNAKNVKVGDKVRTRVQLGEFESEVIG